MLRALVLSALAAVFPVAASGQALVVLHIKVTVRNAAQTAIPLARHALLVSDNPSTSSPLRVLTAADGTVDVRLRPGSYTVESDEPVAFGGKGYQWTQMVEIKAGRDLVLELTAENAEIGTAPAVSASGPPVIDQTLLLSQWKDSVVAVWTPESRGSGFIVDAAGLVATSQRVVGGATAVEVQLTSSVKVAARVLVADRVRDVVILWIDPTLTASVPPLPLGCGAGSKPPLTSGQTLVAIGAPMRGPKDVALGDVRRVEPRGGVADFSLAPGGAGGPVFDASGGVVGISSIVDDEDERRRLERIVPTADVCEAVKTAETGMRTAQRPVATHLPVEPLKPFPAEAFAAAPHDSDPSLYQVSSSDFDIALVTPVLVYAAQHDTQQTKPRTGSGSTRDLDVQRGKPAAITDFGGWSEYFEDVPPVLAIRVTPKLAESFWTTVARGAAYTQGVAVPAIKHFKPGFSRLRAFCGDVEVTPIHPLTLERRVSETDAVREGLYIFEPQTLGPQCRTVKLLVYSEKAPDKPDARTIDPSMVERVWQDFAPYRASVQ
jgi:S1-C subfamily serine protease